jgi:hypothetical protein
VVGGLLFELHRLDACGVTRRIIGHGQLTTGH